MDSESLLIWEAYTRSIIEESMTAVVAGVRDEHEKKYATLLDIEYNLLNRALFYDIKWSEFEKAYFSENRPYETFSPDGGSSAFGSTGTINFYYEGILNNKMPEALAAISKRLTDTGFKFEISDPEKRDDKPDVIRIHILANPEDERDIDEAPYIQYANANMIAILRTLGLDEIAEDYSGSVSVDELLMRIRNVSQSSRESNLRPRYHSDMEKFRNPEKEYKGPTIIDPGLSPDEIDSRLQDMFNLASWAKKNGYKEISFG